MAQGVNPVLLYHHDGYRVERLDLKGRHSAGEGFLTAFLDQSEAADIHALCLGRESANYFVQTIRTCGRPLNPRPIGRTDVAALQRQGVLNLPTPGLAEEALLRAFLGDASHALCGVTHTISSKEMLDAVAAMTVAPVQPWDTLICTSQAVVEALSGVLDAAEENLRARTGARRFVRPMMPVIPLGVHAKRFSRSPEDRRRWRAKLRLADDEIAVLFFGRLSVHAKASPFQLAHAAEAAAKASGRKFAILWCGRFHDDFQRRVFMDTARAMAPSVGWHHVEGSDPDAVTIWPAADIFCSLSDNIQESFGLTPIEAMAAGLPAVVSNWNGYRSAIRHGENGVLVDSYLPEVSMADLGYRYLSAVDTYDTYIGAVSQVTFVDPHQTAEWLARLGGDPALRKRMGEAARKTIDESFDWLKVLPRYKAQWSEQKAMVEKARAASPRSNTWLRHDPARTFAGFPTRRLEDGTRLAPGPQFAQWGELPKKSGVILNAAMLTGQKQFEAIRAAFVAGKPKTVKEVVAGFQEADRPAVLRTLHWMVKIGLLTLET